MPERTRRWRRRSALAVLSLLLAAGCARKLPPLGGPPDVEPPTVLSVTPDSAATGVSRTPRISVEFSEGMDPRTASVAVEIAPSLKIKQRRWSGRRLTLVLGDSLQAEHTYTLFVGADARDQHGNSLREGRTVPFTTSNRFPPIPYWSSPAAGPWRRGSSSRSSTPKHRAT